MVGFFDIMHDVDSCLIGSIGQAVTDAGWTNTWTEKTMSKNNYWLTQENPQILADMTPGNGWTNDAGQVANFIQTYLIPNAGKLSSKLVLLIQSQIAKWYNKNDWGAVLGAIGSLSSMVSAEMTQDTTTGEAQGKNMQSQLQTDNSALQPISDFGSSWAQFLGALANVLSQIGPGG